MSSRWCDPPSDILPTIADYLDCNLGLLHLRSVCQSWRSSLPLPQPPPSSSSTTVTFPLHLPPPPSTTSPHLSLHQRTLYLLSPLHSPPTTPPFIIKVEQTAKPNDTTESRNTFSLFNSLFSRAKLPPPNSPINLLHHRITSVCDSYAASADPNPDPNPNPIQKVAVARDFFTKGDFVVLALNYDGELLLWKFGDDQWTEIAAANGRCFDDVICYGGKFYATANKNGMLVMIDSRLTPYCLVSKLLYGNGDCTSLVECNGGLYLLDRETDSRGRVRFGVFKLDDKRQFWDYEPLLDGCVVFLGDDSNFALSKKDCIGCIRDVVFFKDVVVNEGVFGGFSRVFDVKSGDSCFVVDDESFAMFYWPPSSWFDGADTDCFR